MDSLKFEFKWHSRAGPVLLISFKDEKFCVALFCHRRKDRSITMFGYTLPLCARCTGLLIGMVAAYLLFSFNLTLPLLGAIALILPMLFDGFSQLFGLRKSNNTWRVLTGISFSLGVLSLMHGVA